jgi:folate-dependent phosphoribosylglycinamide formyltransferase PurN
MLTLYFSGTGNTRFVAENFSKKNGAECHSIEEDLDFGAVIARHRRVCFCYPIYGSLTVRMQGHTIKL